MGLLLTGIETLRRQKLFSIFLNFSFLLFKYYPINCIIELAQLQNILHIPAKDELDISVHFRIMLLTNLLHTHRHTFFRKRIFRLEELRNIENNQNLIVEKFHRYKAFSLRKQKRIKKSTRRKKDSAALLNIPQISVDDL